MLGKGTRVVGDPSCDTCLASSRSLTHAQASPSGNAAPQQKPPAGRRNGGFLGGLARGVLGFGAGLGRFAARLPVDVAKGAHGALTRATAARLVALWAVKRVPVVAVLYQPIGERLGGRPSSAALSLPSRLSSSQHWLRCSAGHSGWS